MLKKWSNHASRNYNIKFVTHDKTTKILFFANTNDETPTLSQSSALYKFTCPGCSCNYIGKTEWSLHERTKEHV